MVWALAAAQEAGAASPVVALTLAPDQPIPHVYVEDPLIIEFLSDEDIAPAVKVKILNPAGQPILIDLGTLSLKAKSPYWQPIDSAPLERGRYNVLVSLDAAGVALEYSMAFCRIDRPDVEAGSAIRAAPAPVGVFTDSLDPGRLDAFAAVGVRRVRLEASAPDIEQQILAATEAAFEVAVFLDAVEAANGGARAAELARRYADKIARWEIAVSGNGAPLVRSLADTLRGCGAAAPVYLAVERPEALQESLAERAGDIIAGIVVLRTGSEPARLATYRSVIEHAGIERMDILVREGDGANHPTESSPQMIANILSNLAACADQTCIAADLVFSNSEFGDVYVPLSRLTRNLREASYVGRLPAQDAGVQALVFRNGEGWWIAAWRPDGPGTLRVDTNQAEDLALTDASGNPLQSPFKPEAGMFEMAVGPDPVYLFGTGGGVIRAAAVASAQAEAASFIDSDSFRAVLPGELLGMIEEIALGRTPRPDRSRFFALARTFAFLEREWHIGALPQSVAVPAMANLARIMSALCVIEEEDGEAFIEPLQDTLSRCSQYQSAYLTRTGNNARTRGDWLLAEVGRLVAEANRLADSGRSIEASAIATVAEWRARSLEFVREEPTMAAPAPSPEHRDEAAPREEPPAQSTDVEEQTRTAPSDEPPAPSLEKQVYRVQKGDNPSAIARKHGVTTEEVLRWNGWDARRILHIGDEYVIYKSGSQTSGR